MTTYEGLIIVLKIIGFFWGLALARGVTDVVIPYALVRLADRRWQKLHPGVELSRRRK